jgi:beta-lactamase regulating signal transducer with metallopeptidase domain/tetratricopeptide (TPR) repeat protein
MGSAALALPSSLLSAGAPLELLLKASALLLVAMLCARALRHRSAASRHLAWTLGVTGVLLLPAASAILPSWRIAVPVEVEREGDAPAAVASPSPAALPLLRVVARDARAPAAARPRAMASRAAGLRLGAIANALGIAWALGSAVALARFVAAIRSALRLARRGRAIAGDDVLDLAAALGVAARVRLVGSGAALVPMTLGAIRPVILVPDGFTSWDPSRRRTVLLHELAHVQRHDWLVQCVAQLGCVAFWFHPLVRLAARSLRQEAEQAADDLVLAHGTKPSSYAADLVDLVRSLQPPTGSHAMTVSMIGGPFDGRIRAILESSRSRGPVPARLRFALVAASAATFLALSAVDVTAQPAEPPKAPEQGTWTQVCDAVHAAMREVHAHVRALHGGNAGADMYAEAMDLHRAGDYQAAIAAFEKVLESGYRTDAASYNIACGHARLGHSDEALAWLQRAVDEGFAIGDYLEDDDDLASLRSDSRFQRFAEENADVDESAAMLRRLEKLRAASSTDADAWADVGSDLHSDGQHAAAAEAYARAAALEPGSDTVLYNLACARSLAGDENGALDALEQSIEAGYADAEHMREDSDLDPIRDAQRYQQLAHDVELLGGPLHVKVLGFELGDDAGAWAETAKNRESFVKAHPQSGAGWFQLGFAALRSGDADRGIVAFGKAHDLGHRPGTSAYNVACSHAVAGHRDAAFEWLARAQSEGFDVASHAGDDDDLQSLHADPRFAPYSSAHHSVVQRVFEF